MVKKSLGSIGRFIRAYALFSFAVFGALVALTLTLLHRQTPAQWVLIVVSAIALIPLIGRMIDEIRSGKYGVDILALLAIIVSIILGQDWAAIVVLIMLTGGESLELFAARRARSELRDLLQRAPQQAHVVHKGKIVDVTANAVQAGDTIVIYPGEVVPADAAIIEGTSSFDESSLTGESVPASKSMGGSILSGSVSIDGEVTARATASAAGSQYQQIIRLVESAAAHPAPFTRLADRYSIPFTVIALTIGGVAWILTRDPIRFLDVLVVATPCPLILAVPVALIAGMSRASREGIIIKTGSALEELAEAKTFAFDKTGTLTKGMPVVANVTALAPFKQEDVLAYAATVEQASTHVLARAIVSAAQAQSLRLAKPRHVREIAGKGLEAHLQGKDVFVGRMALMQEHDIVLPGSLGKQAGSKTVTYVAVGGKLAGYITFTDELRQEASSTLTALKKMGVRHMMMVTGDNHGAADLIAGELGLTKVVAEALPADKIVAVERLTDRPVAFVGDGVNDAPVLMAANVGIALGARGSTAASESADIVIMKDDLSYVVRAVAIARRSFRIATQSIAVGISLSIILMFVFATGRFSPITGAVVQEVVDVIVILNALRARTGLALKN